MRLLLLPILLLPLTACGGSGPLPKSPDARLAEEIEGKLKQVPCIGPMDRWERHYTFNSKPSVLAMLLSLGSSSRWFDYRSVRIDYRQAGFEEFHRGRFLGKEVPPAADDRQYEVVFGDYDIPNHTAILWACGSNVGGSVTEDIAVR